MPKIDNKVFCINHPDIEMDEYFDFMFHNTEKGDDRKYYKTSTVIIGAPFICHICGYMELYSLNADQDLATNSDKK
uniref:Uncharacterized protein n=1 Tax=viral metagenome TaxID=1070528 RepID=A0A6M3KIQ2_9ZZZZ